MPVKKTYAYHKPTPETGAKLNQIRELFSGLHDELEKILPGSRETSLVYTNLEQACMWATKSAIVGDPASEVVQ